MCPHGTVVGSRWSYHGHKDLCIRRRCCVPLQPGLHRFSSRCPLFFMLLHDTHPKRVCRKGRQRGGGAGAFSLTRLVSAAARASTPPPCPAPLPFNESLPRPLRSQGATFAAVRGLLCTSQTVPPPIPVFVITRHLRRGSVSIKDL